MTVAAAAGVKGTMRVLSPGMGVASTAFSCRLSRTPRFCLPALAACTSGYGFMRGGQMHP